MGQAKRRRQQLGPLYGTPEGSNQPRVSDKGASQSDLDQQALAKIRAAQASDVPVVLIGTAAARPLAAAAGLPWLHELPSNEPIPESLAWDPAIANAGGPFLPDGHAPDAITVLGPGSTEMIDQAFAAAGTTELMGLMAELAAAQDGGDNEPWRAVGLGDLLH